MASGRLFRSVAIVGAGAIGGWVAARLALKQPGVSIVARGRTLDLLKAEGLRLTEGGITATAPVSVFRDASEPGPQDLLIIAVKAPALATAAASARPMIGPQTLILPMLNGVPWWFLPGE